MPRRLWHRQLHVADDGGQSREFGMEAELGEQARLRRAAIQWLSGSIPRERIFTHLGWRRRGGSDQWLRAYWHVALEPVELK
jgi:hypothetical protein